MAHDSHAALEHAGIEAHHDDEGHGASGGDAELLPGASEVVIQGFDKTAGDLAKGGVQAIDGFAGIVENFVSMGNAGEGGHSAPPSGH